MGGQDKGQGFFIGGAVNFSHFVPLLFVGDPISPIV
jgi:hypothetical protein